MSYRKKGKIYESKFNTYNFAKKIVKIGPVYPEIIGLQLNNKQFLQAKHIARRASILGGLIIIVPRVFLFCLFQQGIYEDRNMDAQNHEKPSLPTYPPPSVGASPSPTPYPHQPQQYPPQPYPPPTPQYPPPTGPAPPGQPYVYSPTPAGYPSQHAYVTPQYGAAPPPPQPQQQQQQQQVVVVGAGNQQPVIVQHV